MTGAVERSARIIDVDAFECSGEPVRIAFAALFAVGDDVEAGAFLVADGDERGIVLRLVQPIRPHPPKLFCPHPGWKAPGQLLAVDQPIRLRIGADERRRKQLGHLILPPQSCAGGRPVSSMTHV